LKVFLKPGQRVWFTSDSHYNHGNLCRATSNWEDLDSTRDFKSLDQMNDALVDNINSKVGENDYLFHLGDFAFGGVKYIKEFRERINCKNVHLILGNHDYRMVENIDIVRPLFSSMSEYRFLTVFTPFEDTELKHRFVLFHYPIVSWNGMCYGVMHLYGHVHSSQEERIRGVKAMDVGADANNFMPISLEEVVKILEDQEECKYLNIPQRED